MKMITVENLSFLYRKSKRAVLHDFSLSLEKGRITWQKWCRQIYTTLSDEWAAHS